MLVGIEERLEGKGQTNISMSQEDGENSGFNPPEMVSPMQASESIAMQTIMKRHLANSPTRGENRNGGSMFTDNDTPMSNGSSKASPSKMSAGEIGSSLAYAFQSMKNGTLMSKLCRAGPPHMRHFYINASKTKLKWKSQKKNPTKTEVSVGDMMKIVEGPSSEAFKRNLKHLSSADNDRSFSIYYYAKNKTEIRTLDLICKDEKDYSQWLEGIKYLIDNKEQLLDQFLQEKWLHDEHGKSNVLYGSMDVYTMGSSSWGQLGHTENVEELVDVDVPTRVRYFIDQNVTNIRTIDVGDDHMVAATTSGDVYAWGNSGSNRLGQVERHGTVFNHFLLPKYIHFFRNPDLEVTQVACGACHTLFLTAAGVVYAAGSNAVGQLGYGKKVECGNVVKVLVPNPVRYIAAGNMTSAAISTSSISYVHRTVTEIEYAKLGVDDNQRLLYTWGCNLWGATGQGPDPKPCFSPTEVLNAARVNSDVSSYQAYYSCLSLSFGDFHAAAIVECIGFSDGEDQESGVLNQIERVSHRYLMTWGSNAQGQLGHGMDVEDDKETKLPYPQIVKFFDDNYFKPSVVSCGAAHTSLLSLHIGDETYDHSSANDNYSEMCLHTWGLAGACCFFGETPAPTTALIPPSNFITSPKKIEKSELYQNKGETLKPVQRRGTVIGDLFKTAARGSISEGELSEGEKGEKRSKVEAASDDFKSIACGSIFTYILMYSGRTFLLGQPISSIRRALPEYVNKDIDAIAAGGSNVAFIARRKWIPDDEVTECTNCSAQFTTLRRRHHCRNCGGLFCNECTSKRAVVLKYGFDSEVRVCDACYTAIKSIDKQDKE